MTDVLMPQMGESIVEGTLTRWLKKPGDAVKRDEPLFEISTDKVDTEIPSPAEGVLKETLVEAGATVQINTVVARIDDGSAGAAAPAPAEAPKAEAPQPDPAPPAPVAAEAPVPAAAEPAPSSNEDSGPISPLVRRMAREHNLDLAKIPGTGAGGRITKADVEAYLAGQTAAPSPVAASPVAAAPVATAPATPSAPPAAPKPADVAPVAAAEAPRVRVEPMSIMRQKIAEHMVMSKATSAHVTTVHRVDMTKIAKLRNARKNLVKERYGFSLTFLPFITRAAAEALRAFPIVNASIQGSNVLYHNEVNVGIAVALDNGLIVPVIKHADEKNVIGLQRAIADLANRARSKQLKPDEVQGGTFSITNFGSFGSLFATPVINQPQIAILGIGAVNKEVVVVDDAIAIRDMAYLALTFDHRLIDGALADQFCLRIKTVLENWSEDVL
ncbi:MAG: 2-oxoglutarate dehydrogenase, E2 component, dihydrolipoamide succinyltransferase [Bryobacterales bacterium]|jgi:2-oxoglutarate dehydrogenase E2 component (dihydrolipoamide succinyltransferase)|nr:2-oxoglutarate dehydrogenase, E2 component, dihydrolipoamide succinyltransferase [Bryobacterales bacterium]